MSFTTAPSFATLKVDSKSSLKSFKTFLCSVFGVRIYPLFTENAVWLSCTWPVSQMWYGYSLFQLWLFGGPRTSALGRLPSPCCFLLSSHHLTPFALYWRVTADKNLIINPHVWLIELLAWWVAINLAALCWIISFLRAVKSLFPQRSLFFH